MESPTDILTTLPDEVKSARAAGLRYVIPKGRGIERKQTGNGFTYVGPDGSEVNDEETLAGSGLGDSAGVDVGVDQPGSQTRTSKP